MKKLTVLSMITAALLLTACGDSATGAEAKASHETKAEAKTETAMKCNAGKCGDAMKKDATSEAKEAVSNAAEKVKAAAAEKATAAVASVKEAAEKAKEAVAEKATEAVDSAKEAATSAVDSAKEAAEKAKEAVAEKATAAVDSVKEAAASAVDSAKAAADTGAGKALFAKCAGCHGADGKTKAMGKSAIIAGQAAADLETKIHAYKAGTRNEAGMGMVMKGQVASMSDDDIKAIAAYISGL